MHNEISEITRRAVLDELILSLGWMNLFGRYDEVDFLGRIFNLEELPSNDGRFKNRAITRPTTLRLGALRHNPTRSRFVCSTKISSGKCNDRSSRRPPFVVRA